MGDGRLHFLGAEAGIDQRIFSAFRTFLRHGRGVSAKVAAQSRHVSMERERDAAVWTIAGFAAITAEQRS